MAANNIKQQTVLTMADGRRIKYTVLKRSSAGATAAKRAWNNAAPKGSFMHAGMPTHMGPIRMMIVDHQRTKAIAEKIQEASTKYLETSDSADLILALEVYVQHVTEHLWKENNRLFMMAEARLNHTAKDVDKNLEDVEEKKLKELGKTRSDYETLADDLEKSVSEIN